MKFNFPLTAGLLLLATLTVSGQDRKEIGNLILEDGATLEFLGSENSIDVFGDVEIGSEVSITGSFEDVKGKF